MAAPKRTDPSNDFDLAASSRTYFQGFQRALLPGPGGANVETELLAPVHQYVAARVDRLDTPWADDSAGFEFSGWAAVQLAGDDLGSRPDGDVTVANAFHRIGPATFKLGRQLQTAGAARFARFDGLAVDLRTAQGLAATGYGGFTVLPRWNARPSYHHLGSAFDTLIEAPESLPESTRSGDWLAGGRLAYAHESWLAAGVGVHEQRTRSSLERRSASVDLRLAPLEELELNGRLMADLDSGGIADARLATDIYPVEPLVVALEYRRVAPHLLLSKQSVFSVFDSERFDEWGTEAEWAASEQLEFTVGQWMELLGLGDVGSRSQLRVRVYPYGSELVVLQLAYHRIVEPRNGYHSTRLSARWRVASPVSLVAEHYVYFYDKDINGFNLSSVEAASAEYAGRLPFRFLVGGSLAHTPYAAHDAQVSLRVAYDFQRLEEGS